MESASAKTCSWSTGLVIQRFSIIAFLKTDIKKGMAFFDHGFFKNLRTGMEKGKIA